MTATWLTTQTGTGDVGQGQGPDPGKELCFVLLWLGVYFNGCLCLSRCPYFLLFNSDWLFYRHYFRGNWIVYVLCLNWRACVSISGLR